MISMYQFKYKMSTQCEQGKVKIANLYNMTRQKVTFGLKVSKLIKNFFTISTNKLV